MNGVAMGRRWWTAVLVSLAMLGLVAPAQAADPPGLDVSAEVRARHAAAASYWTAERIAAAVPAGPVVGPRAAGPPATEVAVDCTHPRNKKHPDCGGGGGGGGDDGDGGVNCNKKSNRDLPECTGGGGGGGGEDPTGPPAATTGSPWTNSAYDVDGSDLRVLVGKVLFTLGTTDYVCSGSVVTDGATDDGRALVVTAGHCVHEGDNATWATNWTFIPDFDQDVDGSVFSCGDSPYGCWTAGALVVTGDWALAGHLDYDVGFAVLEDGGHEHALQPLEDMLATEGASPSAIGFNRARGEYVAAFGYPHATPYDGKRLIYCAGDAIPYHWWIPDVFLFSYAQGLACDQTGGSSGGPWMGDFESSTGTGTVMGVNSYKMNDDPNTMYGTYFGNYAEATYQTALTATTNTTVPRPPVPMP